MLTTSPHLYVRRPSPTTAEFLVTTRPPSTLSFRIALAAVSLGRCLLASAVVLLLCAEWDVLNATSADSPADATIGSSARPIRDGPGWPAYLASLSSSSSSSTSSSLDYPQTTATATTATAATLLLHLHQSITASPAGQLAARLATPDIIPPWALAALCAALLWVALLPLHTTESLLVLRGLGIQTFSSGPTCLSSGPSLNSHHSPPSSNTGGGGGDRGSLLRRLLGLGGPSLRLGGGGGGSGSGGRTRFIPTEKIRDVLINEAFRGFEVRYCLVVVVEGEEDLVVVFPRLLPPRRIVEKVWRGVRGCLYEPDGVRRLDDKG